DELARYRTADDALAELEPRTPRQRMHFQRHPGVLAVAAGLLFVRVVALRGLRDRLPVRHARRCQFNVDVELAPQPVDRHLEVRVAKAGQHDLARTVAAELQARV